jgi:signal transduction histidine kinase
VIDDGKGFSEEERQRLFEPFASTKENGLGLGLVISRRIIEEHGGTLTATHTAGGGATFVITLPENPMPLPAS